MKTLSTLFLTLTLIASSAHAVSSGQANSIRNKIEEEIEFLSGVTSRDFDKLRSQLSANEQMNALVATGGAKPQVGPYAGTALVNHYKQILVNKAEKMGDKLALLDFSVCQSLLSHARAYIENTCTVVQALLNDPELSAHDTYDVIGGLRSLHDNLLLWKSVIIEAQ